LRIDEAIRLCRQTPVRRPPPLTVIQRSAFRDEGPLVAFRRSRKPKI
jgi:hypothetical protein